MREIGTNWIAEWLNWMFSPPTGKPQTNISGKAWEGKLDQHARPLAGVTSLSIV
jgi:hypothetical protein